MSVLMAHYKVNLVVFYTPFHSCGSVCLTTPILALGYKQCQWAQSCKTARNIKMILINDCSRTVLMYIVSTYHFTIIRFWLFYTLWRLF